MRGSCAFRSGCWSIGAAWVLSACSAGDVGINTDVHHIDAADVAPPIDVQSTPEVAVDVPPPMARCGDGMCTAGMEDCMSCPLDCNACPTCDMAPSCTGALAVPTSTMSLTDCNNTAMGSDRTNYACGTTLGVPPGATTCADPQLRIRIQQMTIQRGWFDIPKQMYCVITAEDGAHSELLLTTPHDVAGNQATTDINLPLSNAIVWGQSDLYRSISDITITYGCFITSNGGAAQSVLNDIANRAMMVSAYAGAYGWVFGTVAVLSTVLGSSLGTLSDTQILDVQQTISSSALLTMTNGRTWGIHSHVGDLNLSGAADLELTMESWGCADVRHITP